MRELTTAEMEFVSGGGDKGHDDNGGTSVDNSSDINLLSNILNDVLDLFSNNDDNTNSRISLL